MAQLKLVALPIPRPLVQNTEFDHHASILAAADAILEALLECQEIQSEKHKTIGKIVQDVAGFAAAAQDTADDRAKDSLANTVHTAVGLLELQISNDTKLNAELLDNFRFCLSTSSMLEAADRHKEYTEEMLQKNQELANQRVFWRSLDQDGPPPEDRPVLVKTGDGEVVVAIWKKHHSGFYQRRTFLQHVSKVTHWAEIPE